MSEHERIFLKRLWSAVGERKKWSAGGETAGTKAGAQRPPPSRRRKPAADAANSIAARDEGVLCAVERARLVGNRAAVSREAKQRTRWSRRIKFLGAFRSTLPISLVN